VCPARVCRGFWASRSDSSISFPFAVAIPPRGRNASPRPATLPRSPPEGRSKRKVLPAPDSPSIAPSDESSNPSIELPLGSGRSFAPESVLKRDRRTLWSVATARVSFGANASARGPTGDRTPGASCASNVEVDHAVTPSTVQAASVFRSGENATLVTLLP
jgi:hypothetical protein